MRLSIKGPPKQETLLSQPDVPAKILAKLRSVCLSLPEAYEESAWRGTRWMIRKKTFAHVLAIYDGRPRAYARAAKSDGPLVVMTVRASGPAHDELCASGHPFFHAPWGVKWGAQVVGVALEGRTDWKKLSAIIAESYRLLAFRKR